MKDTENLKYIYTVEDLIKFRDSVNKGDNFKGKTVYLMLDLDLGTICGEKIGSWERIGTENMPFLRNI